MTLARWVPRTRAEVAGVHWQRNLRVAPLSAPGSCAQRSTALRAVTLLQYESLAVHRVQILRVGADRRVRTTAEHPPREPKTRSNQTPYLRFDNR